MSASRDSKYLSFEILVRDERNPSTSRVLWWAAARPTQTWHPTLLQKGWVGGAKEGEEKKVGKRQCWGSTGTSVSRKGRAKPACSAAGFGWCPWQHKWTVRSGAHWVSFCWGWNSTRTKTACEIMLFGHLVVAVVVEKTRKERRGKIKKGQGNYSSRGMVHVCISKTRNFNFPLGNFKLCFSYCHRNCQK